MRCRVSRCSRCLYTFQCNWTSLFASTACTNRCMELAESPREDQSQSAVLNNFTGLVAAGRERRMARSVGVPAYLWSNVFTSVWHVCACCQSLLLFFHLCKSCRIVQLANPSFFFFSFFQYYCSVNISGEYVHSFAVAVYEIHSFLPLKEYWHNLDSCWLHNYGVKPQFLESAPNN